MAYSKFFPQGGFAGVLHHYTETLTTFEFTTNTIRKPHSLLFVGGLGDGLGTTSYLADLARALQPTPWSLFTLTITSSYQSWGLGHLDRDTTEIATCLKYISDYKTDKYGSPGKLVFMGHSTGSQNVLHYLHRPNPLTSNPDFDPYLQHITRPVLDGAIMQAPVSDREAMGLVMEEGIRGNTPEECQAMFKELVTTAQGIAKQNLPYDVLLPMHLTCQIGYPDGTPLTARRFLSLISPSSPENPAEDDLFSSDLTDEQFGTTFGAIRERGLLKNKLMVMISGGDQAMPPTVDKQEMLGRFQRATELKGQPSIWDDVHSSVIPNASHALSNDDQAEPRRFLCEKVMGYLGTLDA